MKTSKTFLQSKDWMEFQRSIGREVFEFDGSIKAGAVIHDMPLGKNYLYIPHGPEVDFNMMSGGIKNEVNSFISRLKKIAKEKKSVFIKTEPLMDNVAQILVESGFKRSAKNITPRKTVIIDLKKSEEDLLSVMHHKTRYNIKVAERHGVKIKDSKDSEIFWKLLQKTTQRDKFSPHPKEYYRKLLDYFASDKERAIKASLVLALYNDKPIAGMIILLHEGKAYYLHGASDHNFRHLMAPYLMHWENIKYLQDNGFGEYDLWGIDAYKWPGVTRFKLGWGGRVVERPGSFDLPINNFWHLVYKGYRKIFRK